jgi:hypothetical protein
MGSGGLHDACCPSVPMHVDCAAIWKSVTIPTPSDARDTDPWKMSRDVAQSLCGIYHRREPVTTHLIFPKKRKDVTRVSEQESRILVAQLLEARGVYFSVETPTGETYRMRGQRELSARTDVTAYGPGGVDDRQLNIELKAGNPGIEIFRKDLEKLLRERVQGLWFHTLTNANGRTWSALEAKICAALDRAWGGRFPFTPFCLLCPPITGTEAVRSQLHCGLAPTNRLWFRASCRTARTYFW